MSYEPSIIFISLFLIDFGHSKLFKDKLKQFLKRILQGIARKKNNTWNIRCLVDESFVPASQKTSLSYWRLTDFKWSLSVYSTWDIYVWHCNEQRQWRHFSKSSLISQPSSTVPPALEALCIVTYEGAAALVPWLAAAAHVALGARHCGGRHGAHGSRGARHSKGATVNCGANARCIIIRTHVLWN